MRQTVEEEAARRQCAAEASRRAVARRRDCAAALERQLARAPPQAPSALGLEQLLDEFALLKAACDRGAREQLEAEGTADERGLLERADHRLDQLAEAAAAAEEAARVAAAGAAAVGLVAAEGHCQPGESEADLVGNTDEDEDVLEVAGAFSRGTRKQRKAKARSAAVRAAMHVGLDLDEARGDAVAAQ